MDVSTVQLEDANGKLDEVNEALNVISQKVAVTFDEVNSLLEVNKVIDGSKEQTLSSLESISAVIEESASTAEEIGASLDVQSHMIEDISQQAEAVKESATTLDTQTQQFKL